jgi:hypothetical protein
VLNHDRAHDRILADFLKLVAKLDPAVSNALEWICYKNGMAFADLNKADDLRKSIKEAGCTE